MQAIFFLGQVQVFAFCFFKIFDHVCYFHGWLFSPVFQFLIWNFFCEIYSGHRILQRGYICLFRLFSNYPINFESGLFGSLNGWLLFFFNGVFALISTHNRLRVHRRYPFLSIISYFRKNQLIALEQLYLIDFSINPSILPFLLGIFQQKLSLYLQLCLRPNLYGFYFIL